MPLMPGGLLPFSHMRRAFFAQHDETALRATRFAFDNASSVRDSPLAPASHSSNTRPR
ncbi:hypothetical protein BCAR13_560022 [Paraburkholderia caribensis]|nr:hypothetical protein BCAR13_560022 [Paraburkholderia caribensis]